jgi:hypothetical protein
VRSLCQHLFEKNPLNLDRWMIYAWLYFPKKFWKRELQLQSGLAQEIQEHLIERSEWYHPDSRLSLHHQSAMCSERFVAIWLVIYNQSSHDVLEE